MSALEEFYRFCFEHGGTLRNHKDFGSLYRQTAFEFTKLKSELEKTAEKASYLVVLRKQIDDLREELKEAQRIIEYYAKDDPEPAESWLREVQVMTESEYKDCLSEQDRIKRQEEEQR